MARRNDEEAAQREPFPKGDDLLNIVFVARHLCIAADTPRSSLLDLSVLLNNLCNHNRGFFSRIQRTRNDVCLLQISDE